MLFQITSIQKRKYSFKYCDWNALQIKLKNKNIRKSQSDSDSEARRTCLA